jgi:hypothetical protein
MREIRILPESPVPDKITHLAVLEVALKSGDRVEIGRAFDVLAGELMELHDQAPDVDLSGTIGGLYEVCWGTARHLLDPPARKQKRRWFR